MTPWQKEAFIKSCKSINNLPKHWAEYRAHSCIHESSVCPLLICSSDALDTLLKWSCGCHPNTVYHVVRIVAKNATRWLACLVSHISTYGNTTRNSWLNNSCLSIKLQCCRYVTVYPHVHHSSTQNDYCNILFLNCFL